MTAGQRSDVHVTDRIDDFLAGRLGPAQELEFETHLLACDACFAQYLLRTVTTL